MSRSKGEVHDNVPTSSSSHGALFELCLFVGTDVVMKFTTRTDGCLKRVSICGSGVGTTLLRLGVVCSTARVGMVTERRMRGSDFFETCISTSSMVPILEVNPSDSLPLSS